MAFKMTGFVPHGSSPMKQNWWKEFKGKVGRSKLVRGAQRIINPDKAKDMDEMDAYHARQQQEAKKKTERQVERLVKERDKKFK